MDGKVFTKETKDLIVKVGDDIIKLPFYAEPLDGPALRILINFIDTKADKFIPDNIDPIINSAITLALNGELDGASIEIGTAINLVVDIPLLDEDHEQKLFVDGTSFILSLINNWIQNKK